MTKTKTIKLVNVKAVIYIFIALIALYVILPEIKSFKASIYYLKQPKIGYFVLSALFTFLTYCWAALSYQTLAFNKIIFRVELLIQNASMFINNLLPAGIGGLGANYSYLKHEKHTTSEASSVVALNNLLGAFGHLLILFTVLIILGFRSGLNSSSQLKSNKFLISAFAILVALVVLLLVFGRVRIAKFVVDIKTQLLTFKDRPISILKALVFQLLITVSNVLALFFSVKALGFYLSFTACLVIFTFGAGIKNATPTPGGLGGYEAGLVAALVAYKFTAATSLSIVLIYRIANYWLPLICGIFSFIYANNRKLFSV